jgi:polyphosphate kinase
LFTADQAICEDVNEIFLQLTGLGKAVKLSHLWQAPFNLHAQLLNAINYEKEHAKAGRRGHIIAKMNALLDKEIIEALYEASRAGVKIDLIVRGVCSLRPGIRNLSENIRVRSVIGRFLEHSRIFYFRNNGEHNIYLASADWMPRNFFRRIEICFPILDNRLKKRIMREGLKPYLKDNTQAWEMQPDGQYRLKSGHPQKEVCAQLDLLEELAAVSK